MTNKDRFERFSQDNDWLNRFTWRGIYGDKLMTSISIVKFNKETSYFKTVSLENTIDFYKKMKTIAIHYSDWCITKFPHLKEEEINNLRLFFIGAIGEYFFVKLFEHKNTLIVKGKVYSFYDIAPRMHEEIDFGVDMTGRRFLNGNNGESCDCVFQVKFWNPYGGGIIENRIAQAVHSDAIENEMINNKDNENIFICWLGEMKNVSMWLSKNKINRHIVFIDKQVLKNNIDNDKIFWEKITKDIAKI